MCGNKNESYSHINDVINSYNRQTNGGLSEITALEDFPLF